MLHSQSQEENLVKQNQKNLHRLFLKTKVNTTRNILKRKIQILFVEVRNNIQAPSCISCDVSCLPWVVLHKCLIKVPSMSIIMTMMMRTKMTTKTMTPTTMIPEGSCPSSRPARSTRLSQFRGHPVGNETSMALSLGAREYYRATAAETTIFVGET